MLTVAEETLQELAVERNKKISTHLHGQEINAGTYAICKADLLLKGEGSAADNIVGGPEHSTLSTDAFPTRRFDFMLSNPPYGKSWKSDLERMGGKKEMRDPRFMIEHAGDPEFPLVTRSSDGQMLFLVNKFSKMKSGPLDSRIAEVHNGSSLFTGDAGRGESNIRRWIIENDWLEAIVALLLNLFYNTGIATYIWVLTNRKPEHRKGKVQLIDATQWYQPLRKNLGKKNCDELGEKDIDRICEAFRDFGESEQSKIFPNKEFGYWKVTVERPLRLAIDLSDDKRRPFRADCRDVDEESLAQVVDWVADRIGAGPHLDFNDFLEAVKKEAREHKMKLSSKRVKLLKTKLAHRNEKAQALIAKTYHDNKVDPCPIRGLIKVGDGRVVEYEPDPELRDSETIPLLEEGGIEGFLEREVVPYARDAWYQVDNVKVGYEISFTRHFYKPPPMRTLEEIRADIVALEKENEGLLLEILATGNDRTPA